MKRREFLKSMTALTAASAISAPAVWSPAKAQARKETLLLVTENGPNNLDIHGLGTNRPGYEASWNCYDRLIRNDKKTLADGSIAYERDKYEIELAEDMNPGDMSMTFKLKKNAKFQDGTPVTAKDVKWSFDRAVTVGGFPTVQMKAGSLLKSEQFVVVDDNTFRVDLIKKDRLTVPDLAVIVPGIYNSELLKKHATDKDPWALDYAEGERRGQLRLRRGDDELEARRIKVVGGARRLGRRQASRAEKGHLAHHPLRRQPPRADGARRRRHLLRPAGQGLLRDEEGGEAGADLQSDHQRHVQRRNERGASALR